jgi:hypothetical protein
VSGGIIYVEGATVEATTGHMLVTLDSGGDVFQFHLPRNVALKFRDKIMRDAWQVCCVPEEPIPFKPRRGKR